MSIIDEAKKLKKEQEEKDEHNRIINAINQKLANIESYENSIKSSKESITKLKKELVEIESGDYSSIQYTITISGNCTLNSYSPLSSF